MTTERKRAQYMKYHVVYKTTRCDGSGKYYIGMHSTDRLDDDYLGSGQILWRSIKKYGRDVHKREILYILPTRKEAVLKEHEILNSISRDDALCMNISRSIGFSERKVERPSASEKRRHSIISFYADHAKSAAARQKISQANKGRKATAEAKSNLSVAAKKRMARMQQDGSWEEVKKKNAEAHHGKVQSPETKALRIKSLAETRKRQGGKFIFSKQARANISKSLIGTQRNAKKWKLICTTTGDEQEILNLQGWLKANNLVTTRDRKGIKRAYTNTVLFTLLPVEKHCENTSTRQ